MASVPNPTKDCSVGTFNDPLNDHLEFPNQLTNRENKRKEGTYTFVSSREQQASGFKKDKSRITFAACSNADGSLKIPILIIGRSAKPRVLKSRSAETLPVFYTYSKSSWMTSAIFQNWFETEFVPKVQIFLRQKGLLMKAILLVDNCKSHVMLSVRDIKTEFFPPNITSIVQPMDQGILEILKRRYRARLVSTFVDAAKKGTAIPEYLKSITLDNVVNWISEDWNKMSSSTIYRCWRKIWPVQIRDAETQTESTSQVLTPLYLMVENESDETMLDKLVNTDEVLESLRSLEEFASIEKVAVESWMNKTENWDELDVEEREKTVNLDMMDLASNTYNENSNVNTPSDFSVVRDALNCKI
ncbi:tigger transposable element-derived protein 2-like [Microplitis demolitor]|uniref:tigger transposable element-derived protein 2-like n=1 Tax=Microplitis demolitor TaxID=69319 RepID=UPI00235B6346|nr:tigger transposable element-derived protein 2-like [Microplitis demolitor]